MKKIFVCHFVIIVMGISVLTQCKKDQVPEITTISVSNITATTAACGGNVTNEGSSPIISRGICWSTGTTPTIADNKTSDGTGAGSFSSSITDLKSATLYYVRAYATNRIGTGYGEAMTFTTFGQAPTPTARAATNITLTSASLQGSVNANYLSTDVTFEYGTTTSYGNFATVTQSPITGNTTTDVSADITGLTIATTYHYRIKAVNSLGTSYGNDASFTTVSATVTDVDGNIYNVVSIGTQVWMAENLKTKKYLNGDLIGTTTSPTQDLTSEFAPKYQWAYDGNEANVTAYGRLYTWFVVSDSRNICPTGWHVPSDVEWIAMENYLISKGYNYDGTTYGGKDSNNKIAKALSSASDWYGSINPGAVGNIDFPAKRNITGFTAIPAGVRSWTGVYYYQHEMSSFWSVTEEYPTASKYWFLYFNNNYMYNYIDSKKSGMSVRCLKN